MISYFDYYDKTTKTWFTNPNYTEILKLDRMLTEANIPHTLQRMFDGWQVIYPDATSRCGAVMDAVEHYGSYGNSDDTLEIMGLLTPEEEQYDSVSGHLTAENVFERIRKHHAGEWNAYYYSLKDIFSTTETAENASFVKPATSNEPMTPEEFKNLMANAKSRYNELDDEEETHIEMDGLMCNLLRQLGYGEGVDIFNNTPKWYA